MMGKVANIYFELKEQAEYFGMDLDFETLEFIPYKPVKKTKEWPKGDFDERIDIDYE